jgi:hypothetical protein
LDLSSQSPHWHASIASKEHPVGKPLKDSTFIALWIHDSSITELYDQDNQEINQKRKGEKLC